MRDTMFKPPASLRRADRAHGSRHLNGQAMARGGARSHRALHGRRRGARGCVLDRGRSGALCADDARRGASFAPATIALFTSPASPPDHPILRGLGWDIDSPYSSNRGDIFPRGTSYGHTGFTGPALWIDPASKSFVVIMTNRVHPKGGRSINEWRRSDRDHRRERPGPRPEERSGDDGTRRARASEVRSVRRPSGGIDHQPDRHRPPGPPQRRRDARGGREGRARCLLRSTESRAAKTGRISATRATRPPGFPSAASTTTAATG